LCSTTSSQPATAVLRLAALLAMLVSLSGCYIEAGGCSGPLCVGVSSNSNTCGVSSFCEQASSASHRRCPDADQVQIVAERTIAAERARDGRCDGALLGAVPALQWNDSVFTAADRHALDMAGANFTSLTGSDGLDVGARLRSAGISHSAAAQLVGAGFTRSEAVLAEWLDQRRACGQLRDPVYTDFALACRADSDSDKGTYWSLVLTAPR